MTYLDSPLVPPLVKLLKGDPPLQVVYQLSAETRHGCLLASLASG